MARPAFAATPALVTARMPPAAPGPPPLPTSEALSASSAAAICTHHGHSVSDAAAQQRKTRIARRVSLSAASCTRGSGCEALGRRSGCQALRLHSGGDPVCRVNKPRAWVQNAHGADAPRRHRHPTGQHPRGETAKSPASLSPGEAEAVALAGHLSTACLACLACHAARQAPLPHWPHPKPSRGVGERDQ